MDPRPKVFCVNIPETRDAKARIICFTRGLAIGSQTNPKSFEEQQQELRQELQRRAEERRGMLPALPSPPVGD